MIVLQNPYCARAEVDGELLARQGAMVAYRGELAIAVRGQGVRNLLKRAVTGERLPLMEVIGRGEMWLPDLAKNVVVVDGDGLTVAGKGVLCFEPTLTYEIGRVKGAGMAGGGLFNCTFAGTGSLALVADGEPMTIAVIVQLKQGPILPKKDGIGDAVGELLG